MYKPTPSLSLTAARAYAARVRRIDAILGWLGEELSTHAQKHQASPRNWGLVGDLAAIEGRLKEALCQISGMDQPNVNSALEDLEEA